jgi:hypothetical protein
MVRHSGRPRHAVGYLGPADFPTFPSSLPAAFWDGGHNAVLVQPKPSQEALCILHAAGYFPVVWNGHSFFLPAAESFVPSNEIFYFFIRPSQTVRGEWYVWAPMHHRKDVRVSDSTKPCC